MIVFSWIITLLFIGLSFYPLANLIFYKFEDRGWLFSKMIGLFISGWITWVFNCLYINANPTLVVILCAMINYIVFYIFQNRVHFKKINLKLILIEEVMFTAIFIAGAYILGFSPDALGTEKPMDFMFMVAMMRDYKMPFLDPWCSGERINYYYGGQYYATFLTKVSNAPVGYGYNLMRITIAAISFMYPFSLVYQMLRDRKIRHAWFGGILSGMATGFCGNGHYVVYGIVKPLLGKIKGETVSYWFADSTRYIGYRPDLNDKTIHEIPAYSNILGDLHAHYISIIFVTTIIAIIYAWAQKSDKHLKRPYLCPEVWLIGFMTGVFRWTNFWDFPIYFVVCGSIFFFVLLKDAIKAKNFKRFIINMLIIAAIMFVVGYLASLPFTLSFKQISTVIKITHKHSLPHQMLVLWGFPVFFVMVFIAKTLYDKKMELPDLCTILFGLCAMGLVLLPEFIFVLDIYGDEYERANTMFKLTFQACILFGIVAGYVVSVLLAELKRLKFIPVLCVLFLFVEVTYMKNLCWYGNFLNPSTRIGLDASAYASWKYAKDYDGIQYLNELEGVHIVLEAAGESYDEVGRISGLTGHQTVIGWPTHEWLWHDDYHIVSERSSDVYQIYTSIDSKKVAELIEKYDVEYIFIGEKENELYGDRINKELLFDLTDVIGNCDDCYLLKVNKEKMKKYIEQKDAKWVQVYPDGVVTDSTLDYSMLPKEWQDELSQADVDNTPIVDENGQTVIEIGAQ